MARRTHSSASKVFGLVLAIAFGLIGLVITYAAFKGGLEFRSKAATPETVVKAWEFKKEKDAEGWQTQSGEVTSGVFIVNSVWDVPVEIWNKSVNAVLPPGAKLIVQFTVFPSVVVSSLPVLGATTDKNSNVVCAQVLTYARSKDGECKVFATPCDVPSGWVADKSCSITPSPRPTTTNPTPQACAQVLTPARDMKSKKCTVFNTSCISEGFVLDPYCGFPYTFSVDVSYRLKDKTSFEKSVSTSFTLKSEKGQNFTATFPLPILKESQVDEVRINLPQMQMWTGTRIEIDWIHLTAPAPKPTPTCTPLPKCATDGIIGPNGARVFCALDAKPGMTYCPDSSPTPPNGCKYQQVQCVKAPCDAILVCPTPTPTPKPTPIPPPKRPEPTPTPKKSDWCKIMKALPGGTSSPEYKKNCG